MTLDKSIIKKDEIMEDVFSKAQILYSTVVTDGREAALVIYDENRKIAGELVCYKLSYCNDITQENYLSFVNTVFQRFIMKYRKKIDMDSLGKAKYKFDNILLG